MSNTTKPATLTTQDRGVSIPGYKVKPGMYVWHSGAFRLVRSNDGYSVRMGRYAAKTSDLFEVKLHN